MLNLATCVLIPELNIKNLSPLKETGHLFLRYHSRRLENLPFVRTFLNTLLPFLLYLFKHLVICNDVPPEQSQGFGDDHCFIMSRITSRGTGKRWVVWDNTVWRRNGEHRV